MANPNVKTWKYNLGGTLDVTYSDGHSEQMSEADAIKAGIITNPGTASNIGSTNTKAKVSTGSYGASSGTPFSDPGTGQTSNTAFTVPINGIMTPIGTLLQHANDPKMLGSIRQSLVANGLIAKGTKSANTIIQAYTSMLVKAASVSMDPNEWMRQYKASGGGIDTAGGGASSGPSTNISLKTYTANEIQSIAEQTYLNTVGRKPSAKELTDLVTQLNTKEKATPTKTVSTPNAAGNVTTSSTTGGLDEQAFIKSQVESNQALQPEVSRMKDINFSSWLMKAMSSGPEAAGTLANG